MSMVSSIQSLATRVADEFKSVRTLLNGNVANLDALTTTAKSNLVAAINEVNAETGGATTLDDLTDVTITSPATGDLLGYDGTEFANIAGSSLYQPTDSDLTAIAALTTTAFGRDLLTLADQAALLTTIGSATTTEKGVVQLATAAEATTGTSTSKPITPSTLTTVLGDPTTDFVAEFELGLL